MARNYKQGRYKPINPQKYLGDVNKIIYRSGWEKQYFIYCDNNPTILQWNSEDTIVPYLSPLDNKMHRYHIDIYIKYKNTSGEIAQALIEIKPHGQTLEPRRGKKRMKTYTNEVTTYIRNQAKWKAAEIFAEKHGAKFIVLTEVMMPALLL